MQQIENKGTLKGGQRERETKERVGQENRGNVKDGESMRERETKEREDQEKRTQAKESQSMRETKKKQVPARKSDPKERTIYH